MARGFIIGATAGRTTLTVRVCSTPTSLAAAGLDQPATVSYDPAYGYEIAHIVRSGIERMYGGEHSDPNVMYYMTVYNEPYVQPAEPEGVDVDGIVRGIHHISTGEGDGPRTQLLASGVGVPWALEAQRLLKDDWGVKADVWSVTSWSELRRDGLAADEHNFLHPDEEPRVAYLTDKLKEAEGPVVAVSDWMHAVQDQIRQWVPQNYWTLGADGFGFSDTRAAARRFFKIDGPSLAVRASRPWPKEGKVDRAVVGQAIEKYRLHDVNAGTSGTRAARPESVTPSTDGSGSAPTGGPGPTAVLRPVPRRRKRRRETLTWCDAIPPAIWPRRPSSGSKRPCPGTPRCPGPALGVGLVAQAGITSFLQWFEEPASTPAIAPTSSPPLPRAAAQHVSLTQTLQLVRVTVEVMEERVAAAVRRCARRCCRIRARWPSPPPTSTHAPPRPAASGRASRGARGRLDPHR